MSSERRRMAPYPFDSDVPPLKMNAGRSDPGANSRFRIQQTQKSFSTTAFASPLAAPASLKRSARSRGDHRAISSNGQRAEMRASTGLIHAGARGAAFARLRLSPGARTASSLSAAPAAASGPRWRSA